MSAVSDTATSEQPLDQSQVLATTNPAPKSCLAAAVTNKQINSQRDRRTVGPIIAQLFVDSLGMSGTKSQQYLAGPMLRTRVALIYIDKAIE